MKAPKAIRLIQSFSPDTLKRLEDFLNSPYFNKSEALVNYFQALKSLGFGEGIEPDSLSEKAWKRAFPKKKFSKSYFDKLNSDLFSNLKTFIQVERLEEPDRQLDKEVAIAEALQKYGLNKLFGVQAKKADKDLNELLRFDPRLLPVFIRLQDAIYNDQIADPKANLEKISKKIEKAMQEDFLIRWLKFACGILQIATRHSIDHYFLSHLKARTEYYRGEIKRSQNPLVRVHFCLYELSTEKEIEQNFLFLISWMEEYGSRLPVNELAEIMRRSMAFSAQQVNAGRGEFVKYTHDLHRIAEDLQIFRNQEQIRPDVFSFVVHLALQSQDLEWARMFFNTYSPQVEGEDNPMFVKFVDAKINFSQGNYALARDILETGLKNAIKQPGMSWNARHLLLKCYFELEEYDKFENLLESTRQFFSRNQEGLKAFFQRGQTSIRLFRLLFRLVHFVGNESGRLEIHNEILEMLEKKQITDRWFSKKINFNQ